MYRAPIAVAVRSSSAGSSDSSASPWTWTNAYGGSSRSTHRLTRGSRASERPLAVSLPVLKTMLSSSTMNQTGRYQRAPAGRQVTQLAGSRALLQELPNLVILKRSHMNHLITPATKSPRNPSVTLR